MPKLEWPTAWVVIVALIVIGAMAYFKADSTNLVLIVLVLLGGAGAAQLSSIRQQTNGNVTRLMDELAETRKALAQSHPVAPPTEE